MITRVTLLALFALSPQSPLFQVESRLVVLHATVRNDRGELVAGLEREAFTVFEDGLRQPITLFRNDDVPVSLGLVIDNSGSMRTKRAKVEAAALQFARASNPDDEMFVLNFADKSRLDVPFTSDLTVLEAGVARVDSIGGTAIRDAVAAAEGYLTREARRDRKVLIVVTDGDDNASVTPGGTIRTLAERGDIAVYAVGLLSDRDPHAGRARRELVDLTSSTGGIAYFPSAIDEIGRVAVELARQIRMRYTLGYVPRNQALDGSYHRIRVTATGSGHLTVAARAGYYATPSTDRP
jgi:VWFA-related protein